MILRAFSDLYNLFLPRKCTYCGNNLHYSEKEICQKCLFKIPKTNFYDDLENLVFQSFWGRVQIEFASSCFYFHKQGILQELIHQIKYYGKKELAFELGKYFGNSLKNVSFYQNCDALIPVPLHPLKEKRRGYNQSEWIGAGMASSLDIPVRRDILKRHVNSKSQTKKNRTERWENVKEAFSINLSVEKKPKHVLLMDDVITTGATLEACATQLINHLNCKISIASLAYANS